MIWVIGNGESRNILNVASLQGTIVGCNAIIRECAVDYLVCVDRQMIAEVVQSNANLNSLVYTRSEWYEKYKNFLHIRQLPDVPYTRSIRADEPFQWGSGSYAVLLGALKTDDNTVSIIGFDLYSKTEKINNIYKNTKGYDSSNKKAVDPRYWVRQIGMIFRCFPDIQFTIYQEHDWKIPQFWIRPNVILDNISNIS